jgi:hypothetical protein
MKKGRAYVIKATRKEDASGIDFFVKLAGSLILIPVQITQRGVKHFKAREKSRELISNFIHRSDERVARKKEMCTHAGIVFVLVRDFEGPRVTESIARSDKRSLLLALWSSKYRELLL